MNDIVVPVKMQIPADIISTSLVRCYEEFPRGAGNYISIGDDNHEYEVVNLSYEDLKDAKKLGLVGDFIEADVYGSNVAFITDERLPQKALTPRWWYSNRNRFKESILRKELNEYSDECLCKNSKLKFKFMNLCSSKKLSDGQWESEYKCSCGYKETVIGSDENLF